MAESPLLECSLADSRVLSSVVGAVTLPKEHVRASSSIASNETLSQTGIFVASVNGLKVTVQEPSKVSEASGYIPKEVFSSFSVNAGERNMIRFRVDLALLSQCLTMLGLGGSVAVPVRMVLKSDGAPLELTITDERVSAESKVELRTLDVVYADVETLAQSATDTAENSTVFVKSEGLRDALNELDWSSVTVTVSLTTEPRTLQFTASSPAGTTHLTYPDSSDIMVRFECKKTCTYRYSLSLIQPAMKALATSRETGITILPNGMLNLKLILPRDAGDTVPFFVTYIILPKVS